MGATTLADRLLDGAGTGILAHDHQGVVRFLNASVRVLLPDQRVGELLIGALHLRRMVAPRPTRWSSPSPAAACARTGRDLPDGWPPGTVDDATEQHARMDSLLAERSCPGSSPRQPPARPVPAPRKDGAGGGRAGRRRAGARGRGRRPSPGGDAVEWAVSAAAVRSAGPGR